MVVVRVMMVLAMGEKMSYRTDRSGSFSSDSGNYDDVLGCGASGCVVGSYGDGLPCLYLRSCCNRGWLWDTGR